MDHNDAWLAGLLAADVRGQYKRVVEQYQQRLYIFALRLTGGNCQDAEDVLQEAFVSAYLTLLNYPPSRIEVLKLQPWFYKVTLNAFHHHARGAQLQLLPLDLAEDGSALELEAAEEDSPEVLFENRERQQELEAAVISLPERYRVVITCYFFEHLSYQEVSDLLDQPLGTVKSAIHRGVGLLRTRLKESEPAAKEAQTWKSRTHRSS